MLVRKQLNIDKDFIIVVCGRLSVAVISLLAIRLVTTYLSPEDYGQLVILMTVYMFCGLFLINPLAQFINRQTHQWWDEGTLLSRLSSYQYYVLVVSLVGAVLMFYVERKVSLEYSFLVSVLMFFVVLAGTWNTTWVTRLNVLGFRTTSVFWGFATASVGLFASVLLMQWFQIAEAWLFGQAFGMAVGALGSRTALRKYAVNNGHTFSPRELINKEDILTYCIPLSITTGFMWLQLGGYRFVIDSYWGLAQLGYIAVGLALAGQISSLVESLVMQFLYPYFFKRISKDNIREGKQAYSDLLNVVCPLYLVLGGATIIAAPALVYLLVDEKYSGVVIYVAIGAAMESCRAIANVFGTAAQVTRQTSSMILPYVVASVVILLSLLYVRANNLEYYYIGFSLLLGAVSMLFVMVLVMSKQVEFSLDKKRWFFGGLALILLYFFGRGAAELGSYTSAFIQLSIIGIVWATLSFLILWRHPALRRLLLVKLRID